MSVSMDKILPTKNETNAEKERVTKDGRRLIYCLKVIQQPERARACGSGAKSSSDRRPVDPPPIVELRIFKDRVCPENDVTFNINANYFLFATLEQARQIAHGRVQTDQGRLTVLTGTPVAGLVYLDRPGPAGYFLFPDLSVRHEGCYRLSFNLYEELKDENDADQLGTGDETASGVGNTEVRHRLEVKSKPFIVYSAKKFPGLATSTDLSRLVAEQGCRVRIRRDVRLRKRDKNGKEILDDDETLGGDMYTNVGPHHHQTHRGRSASTDSARPVKIAPSPERQMSDPNMMHTYHQHAAQSHYAHMQYPQPPPPPPQYPHPHPHPHPHYPVQTSSYPHSVMPPTQPQAPYGHAQAAAAIPPPPVTYYPYQPQMQPQTVPPPQPNFDPQYPHNRSSISDTQSQASLEYRNPQYPYQPETSRPAQPPAAAAAHAASSYPPPHQAPHPQDMVPYPSNGYVQDAASRPIPPPQKMLPGHLPNINTAYHQVPNRLLEASSPTTAAPSSAYSDQRPPVRTFAAAQVPPVNGKRHYADVFDTQHISGPMRSGSRPSIGSAPTQDGTMKVDPDEAAKLAASMRMSYKRADGRKITKDLL